MVKKRKKKYIKIQLPPKKEEEPKKEAEHTSALEAKNNWEAYKAKYGNPQAWTVLK